MKYAELLKEATEGNPLISSAHVKTNRTSSKYFKACNAIDVSAKCVTASSRSDVHTDKLRKTLTCSLGSTRGSEVFVNCERGNDAPP